MPFAASSVVWVKCGALFWPAKVLDIDADLDPEIRDEIKDEKKKPKYVVKFFDEDGYEFLYDDKKIFEYNCDRKEEFIKKGVTKSRTSANDKSSWFSKFPKDIVQCEEMTGGDPKLLEKPPYLEEKAERVNYKELFGTPDTDKKGKAAASPKKGAQGAGGRKRKATDSPASKKKEPPQKQRPIVHPRFKPGGSGANHTARMMVQPSTPMEIDLIKKQDENESKSSATTSASPGAGAPGTGGGQYNCSICGFSASRINVIILHNKTHTAGEKAGGAQSRSASTPAKSTPKGSRGSAAKAAKSPARTPSTAASGGRGRQTAASRTVATKSKTPTSTTAATASPRGRGRKTDAPAAAATTAEKLPAPGSAAKGGRGRKPAPAAAPAAKSGETSAPTPEKKVRMTKKRKDEMVREEERKKEERKKLLGDWDEENDEDEDDEEKKDSDDEDAGYDFMGDDNVLGNVYEGEEEEEEKERKERESEEAKKREEEETKKRQEEQEEEAARKKQEEEDKAKKEAMKGSEVARTAEDKVSSQQNGKTTENGAPSKDVESSNVADESLALDISKVLEETSVPSLPSAELQTDPPKEKPSRKSVTFSAEKPKEMKQKTIALVQPDSNLEQPDDDDVYDEFVNPREIPHAPPKSYQSRKILKKIVSGEKGEKSKIATPDQKEVEGKNGVGSISVEEPKGITLATAEVDKSASVEIETKMKDGAAESGASAVSQERVIQLGKDWDEQHAVVVGQAETTASSILQTTTVTVAPPTVATQVVTAVPETVATNSASFTTVPATTTTATTAAVAAAAGGNEGTYLILVDETQGAALDQQQTLYIDPSQLANGDLSNMVLMTDEGVAVNVQGLSAQQAGLDQQQLLQQAHHQQQQQQLQEQQQQLPQSETAELPSGQP